MGTKDFSRRPKPGVQGELKQARNEKSTVVLLPVEPYLVHVYWLVSGKDLERAKKSLAKEYSRSKAVLRFYDLTSGASAKVSSHAFFDIDIDIDLGSGNQYVPLWSSAKTYLVELGFRAPSNRFFPLARSNIADTPPDSTRPEKNERFARVTEGFEVIEIEPEEVVDPFPSVSSSVPVPAPESPKAPVLEKIRSAERGLPLAAEVGTSTIEVGASTRNPLQMTSEGVDPTAPNEGELFSASGRVPVGPPRDARARSGDADADQPRDSRGVLSSRLDEFSELRMGLPAPEKEGAPPSPANKVCLQKGRHAECDDLNQMNEDDFCYGVSSRTPDRI